LILDTFPINLFILDISGNFFNFGPFSVTFIHCGYGTFPITFICSGHFLQYFSIADTFLQFVFLHCRHFSSVFFCGYFPWTFIHLDTFPPTFSYHISTFLTIFLMIPLLLTFFLQHSFIVDPFLATFTQCGIFIHYEHFFIV
jgi:hypothetical protein